MRSQGSAAELEARRVEAVRLVRGGLTRAAAGRAVGATTSAVAKWVKRADEQGDAALAARPHPGGKAKSKLSDGQMAELAKLLEQGATAHGWANDLWTCRRVVELIRRRFDVAYTANGVYRLLRLRMRFSCQTPQPAHREQDAAKVAQWRGQTWAALQKKPAARGGSS